ncbi:MAG TPA: DUF1440 domain-containing protein [Acidobacteriaceae bacterium]
MANKTELKTATGTEKSLAKGLLAGLVGGLVGAVAMAVLDRMLTHEEAANPQPIHWGFGAAAGAAYGIAAEFYPAATAREGAAFGMALEGLTQRGVLPLPARLADPAETTSLDLFGELSSRVVYGVTTETVRGFVRKHI